MGAAGEGRYWVGRDAFDEILAQEHATIAARTGRRSADVWTGVSLSGGGIRSASFCLGALQALARAGILSRTDYISTVSGGGYIGAGLQWLLFRDPLSDSSKQHFPYGVDADLLVGTDKGQSNLQYLRWHANYLLPGKGLDIFSALTVVMRTTFLSVAIWFPLLVLFFYSLQLLASLAPVQSFGANYITVSPLPAEWMCPSWKTAAPPCAPSFDATGRSLWPDQHGYFSLVYGISLFAAYLGLVLLAALSLFVAFISITKFPQELTKQFIMGSLAAAALGVFLLLVDYAHISGLAKQILSPISEMRTRITTQDFLWAVGLLVVGLISLLPIVNLVGMLTLGDRYKNADYSLRRFFEVFGGKLLKYTLFAAVFASIPLAHKYVFGATSLPVGGVSVVTGLITALAGHQGQSKQINFGAFSQFGLAVVACIFLYSIMLLSYHVSLYLYNPALAEQDYYYGPIAGAIVGISTIFGIASNSNTIGLHRFYRDRLMELFMPSAESTREGRSTFSFQADRFTVADCWQKRPANNVGLFPIVNCNAILVNDPNAVLSRRGGANFAVTPLHIGGHEHGWELLSSYEKKNREVSLVTAVAASGAAANANSGYAGAGITRNRAVSLVLTLFNIRLGVWIRCPSASSRLNVLKPTPFFPSLWYGPFSGGYSAKSAFVEISDGGHFENLGVYELVRRKLSLIIAFDGEADPTTGLPALVSLSRRIEEDFGATLTFDTSIDAVMPFPPTSARYPDGARFAELPCVKATIRYPNDNRTTTLLYVKASLIEQAPFAARGYRAQHPDYPNESTANQFYSPEQFDAYRELGYVCAEAAVKLHRKEILSLIRKRRIPPA